MGEIFVPENCIDYPSFLLYYYSQTLPHLILPLRHNFQGHCLELLKSKTCCSESVPLCLFDAIFVLRLSKIYTF